MMRSAGGRRRRVLALDACVRRESSRTFSLMTYAEGLLRKEGKERGLELELTRLSLQDMGLTCLDEERLRTRDQLLAGKVYDHPRFALARQFRDADGIIAAAPFWDLSIPAVLKLYIENVSAEGLTFLCDAAGMRGNCRAEWMLYLTTRGGNWENSPMEQGTSYMRSLSRFFGIDRFWHVAVDGIDLEGVDPKEALALGRRELEEMIPRLLSGGPLGQRKEETISREVRQ